MKRIRNSTTEAAIVLLIISVIGKLFGFLRDVLLANYFGTDSVVDAYLMSDSIPGILFGALTAISVGFVPAYYKVEPKEARDKFLNNTLITSFSLSILFILFTYIFSESIVNLCASGFSVQQKNLTESFLRITILSVLFNTPNRILTSYLNCNKQYISSNVANLAVSFTQAVFVVFAAKINIYLLPVGIVVPFIIQFIWLLMFSSRCGYKPLLVAKPDKEVRNLIILSFPIFFSSILSEIGSFIDKSIGSGLQEGSISALNYSFTIRAIFVTMVGTIVTTILFPRISEAVAESDSKKLRDYIEKSLDAIIYFIIPINVFFMVFGKDVIRVLLMRGSFSTDSLEMTCSSFEMYMISLLVVIIREIVIRLMYSNSKTRLNLAFASMEIIINVVLSILLSQPLGHAGLALATSIAAIATFPLYIHELKKEIPSIRLRKRVSIGIKCLVGSVLAVGVSILSSEFIFCVLGNSTLQVLFKLVFVAFISVIVYLIITYAFGVDETKQLLEKTRKLCHR